MVEQFCPQHHGFESRLHQFPECLHFIHFNPVLYCLLILNGQKSFSWVYSWLQIYTHTELNTLNLKLNTLKYTLNQSANSHECKDSILFVQALHKKL